MAIKIQHRPSICGEEANNDCNVVIEGRLVEVMPQPINPFWSHAAIGKGLKDEIRLHGDCNNSLDQFGKDEDLQG